MFRVASAVQYWLGWGQNSQSQATTEKEVSVSEQLSEKHIEKDIEIIEDYSTEFKKPAPDIQHTVVPEATVAQEHKLEEEPEQEISEETFSHSPLIGDPEDSPSTDAVIETKPIESTNSTSAVLMSLSEHKLSVDTDTPEEAVSIQTEKQSAQTDKKYIHPVLSIKQPDSPRDLEAMVTCAGPYLALRNFFNGLFSRFKRTPQEKEIKPQPTMTASQRLVS